MEIRVLLEIAASETRYRLQGQIDEAVPPVRGILEKIRDNLLDVGFEAIFPDPGMAAQFQRVMGLKPGAYLFLQRTVIAARLFCETECTLDEIVSTLPTFKSPRVLHYHCERYFGCSPGRLRQLARKVRLKGGNPRPKLEGYQRCRRGDRQALEAMLDRLESLDREAGRPPCNSRQPLIVLEPGDKAVFAFQCRALALRPHEERLQLLRRGVYEGSGAAFEALYDHAREEGRRDRRKGVELGEMALALVEGNFEYLGEEAPGLLALAWARLGNARRLAADFDGAETAFRRSETWLGKAGKSVVDKEAEILALKGSLRLYQRRFAEAQDLLDEAAGLSEALGNVQLLVDVLHQRAAAQLFQGNAAIAVANLRKARSLIPRHEKRRRMTALQYQMMVYIQLGHAKDSRKFLAEALRLSVELNDRASNLQLRWIEGLCFREDGNLTAAEPLLMEAREGHLDPKDPGMLAIVSLELALLYLEQGQLKKVVAHAAEALPALEALKLPEAASAYKVLHEAILQRRVDRNVLEQARWRLLQPAAPA